MLLLCHYDLEIDIGNRFVDMHNRISNNVGLFNDNSIIVIIIIIIVIIITSSNTMSSILTLTKYVKK